MRRYRYLNPVPPAQNLVSNSNRCRLGNVVLLLPVTDRRTDRVFREHRAVNLHWRQRELLHNVRVRDRHRLVDRLALHPLGRERGRSNRRTAAEGLEFGIFNHVRLGIHADLQPHHVTALRGAYKPRTNLSRALIQRANIPRMIVVVYDLIAISHLVLLSLSSKSVSASLST